MPKKLQRRAHRKRRPFFFALAQGRLEQLAQHQAGRAPRPHFVAPRLDCKLQIIIHAVETLIAQSSLKRLDDQIAGARSFAANHQQGRIKNVDQVRHGHAKRAPGSGENRLHHRVAVLGKRHGLDNALAGAKRRARGACRPL